MRCWSAYTEVMIEFPPRKKNARSYLTVRIVVFLHFHHLLHDPRLELLVLRIQELQVGLVFDDGQPAAEDLGEKKTR